MVYGGAGKVLPRQKPVVMQTNSPRKKRLGPQRAQFHH